MGRNRGKNSSENMGPHTILIVTPVNPLKLLREVGYHDPIGYPGPH